MVDGLMLIRLEKDYGKARHAARRMVKAALRDSRDDRDCGRNSGASRLCVGL